MVEKLMSDYGITRETALSIIAYVEELFGDDDNMILSIASLVSHCIALERP